ncbi:MAG: hypothetical protein AMXMBFR61_15880 [Fimbriimonadales bacterium]
MKRVFEAFGRNRVTTTGAVLVFSSLALLLLLVGLDVAGQITNPYVSIITYMLVPLVLVLGLVLVPLGARSHHLYERKIGKQVDPYFSFDFNDPVVRRRAWFFGATTAMIGLALAAAAYRGSHFMETPKFCGEACHTVMEPEYVAYLRSSHARVPCVDCHIGPGLPWLFRQKLSGLRQTIHFVTNTYQRPIPSPVKDLRPARDVCEVCHWPQRFFGDVVKSVYTFDPDEHNTINLTRITLRVGSHAAQSSGIHSHIEKQVYYMPKDDKRMEMAWVYEQKVDGSTVLWVPEGGEVPEDAGPKARGVRKMDCVDCHNRSAHRFEPFERLVDDAMTRGEISRKIPWIKKMAMDAAPPIDGPITEAQQRKVLGALQAIPERYRTEYPAIFEEYREQIALAARKLAQLYKGTAFPKMKVYPGMQPDLQTHEGCDRCHGVLVAASGMHKGETLSGDCSLCHTEPEMLSGPQAEADAPQR